MSSLIKSIVFATLFTSLPLYACEGHEEQPTPQPKVVQKKESPKPISAQPKKQSKTEPKTAKKLQPKVQTQQHTQPRKKIGRKRLKQYHVHHYYHNVPREYRRSPYREYRQRPTPYVRRYYADAPPPSRVYRYRYYEPARVYYPAPPTIGLNFVFGFR